MTNIPLLIALVIAIPVLIALFIAFFRWLWNITMPDVFGLRAITYWQAFRLLLVSAFLFGGIKYASGGNAHQKLAAVESKLDDANRKLDMVHARLAQQQNAR